jgi:hypothetical protein
MKVPSTYLFDSLVCPFLIPSSRSSHVVHCSCLINSLLHILFSWQERLSNHRSPWLNTERARSHTNYHRCRRRQIPTLAACNRKDEKKNNRWPRPAGTSAGVGHLFQPLGNPRLCTSTKIRFESERRVSRRCRYVCPISLRPLGIFLESLAFYSPRPKVWLSAYGTERSPPNADRPSRHVLPYLNSYALQKWGRRVQLCLLWVTIPWE